MTATSANSPSTRRIALGIALALILCAYTLIVTVCLRPREAIRNLDFWYHISLGYRLQWGDPQTLVNGLYPLGYPLLLRLATQAGIDALRFGQFLSWGGGLLLLSACFSLSYLLTQHLIFTIASSVLLFLNVHFLSYATYEGNDMLTAGLQAVAMVTLWHGTSSEGPRSFSIPLLALHGILLGFAYLTRYTALILFPISLIYLFLLYRRSPRQMFLAWVLVSMPFLVTTSMQLIPSWRVHRNPFYSEQAKNVWFGIYGGYDWVNNWGKVPDTIRLTEVIAMDPARFLQHWLRQLSSAFVSLRLWPLPFHIAWILAVPELLLSRQLALPRRLLLLMVLLFPLGVTALAWLWPRLLLVSLWVEAVLVGWLVFRLKDVVSLNDRVSGGISGAILILAAIVLQWPAAADWLTTLPITRPREVNEFLRMAGMEDAGETATNDPYLHAVDEPTRTRYAQAYSVNPNPKTVEALLTHPSAADWEYLVMDYEQGFGQYAPLRDSFRRAKPFLVPLALSDQRDVYCIMPCLLDDVGPLALSFDSGMQLVGYRWRETRRQGSLYLHWQTEDEITLSYRVLLRVINASGDEVAQIDTIPQSGTFPTTAWPTDTPVIDFYSWPQENACEGCQISLLVYDESSLEPLLATTEAGQRVGPLINLHQSPSSRSK